MSLIYKFIFFLNFIFKFIIYLNILKFVIFELFVKLIIISKLYSSVIEARIMGYDQLNLYVEFFKIYFLVINACY